MALLWFAIALVCGILTGMLIKQIERRLYTDTQCDIHYKKPYFKVPPH